MTIIYHDQQPQKRGYYSKIIGRKLVTKEVGAQSCEVWEQTIPSGGYIVPHYHDFEETITLLTGSVEAQIGDVVQTVASPATLFIPPFVLHGITNSKDEPVHLFAFLATDEAKVIYPEGAEITPVVWKDEA